MTSSLPEQQLMKKNTKLESFLKKCLPLPTFEKIRGYESCIVVSERENKAFKYLVLGEEYIYLTENPPKCIQQKVWLGDVTSVESVNDYPDFLSGVEKRNSQHLAITYRTMSPAKQRSIRRTRKSALHGSSSDITEQSNHSTPLGSYHHLDDSFEKPLSIHSFPMGNPSFPMGNPVFPMGNPSQNTSVSSLTTVKDGVMCHKKKFSADISDDNVLKSLKEEMEDGFVMSDDDELQESNSSKQLYKSYETNHKFISNQSNNNRVNNSHSVNVKHKQDDFSKPSIVTQQPRNTPVSFVPNGAIVTEKPSESIWDRICSCWKVDERKPSLLSNLGKRNSIAPAEFKLALPEIALSPTSDVRLSVSGKNTSQSSVTGMLTPRYFTHSSPMPSTPTSSRAPSVSSRYNSESRSTMVAPSLPDLSLPSYDFSERRDAVINIYLLNLTSPMLMLIRSAWCNVLMKTTLSLKNSKITHVKSSSSVNHTVEDRVFFERLMKYILFEPHTLQSTYSLCDQLKMSALENMATKKNFLKTSEIFLFTVHQLQAYLPRTSCDLATMDGLDTRADELELVVLLVDIISLMFNETEIYPFRVHSLKADRGRCVLDLLMLLMAQIYVPDSTPSMSDDHLSQIDELNKLVCTFTKSAVACVFELFLMAKQAYWNHSEDNFFNISWMIKVLEELKITEKFIEHLVSDILSVIMPTQTPELDPEQTVYFYKQLFVVLAFLENSRRITEFVKSTYREEFKYFIHPSTVSRKLPSRYPLTFLIIQLVDKIKGKVLGVGVASWGWIRCNIVPKLKRRREIRRLRDDATPYPPPT